jgi:hypothetical protein
MMCTGVRARGVPDRMDNIFLCDYKLLLRQRGIKQAQGKKGDVNFATKKKGPDIFVGPGT